MSALGFPDNFEMSGRRLDYDLMSLALGWVMLICWHLFIGFRGDCCWRLSFAVTLVFVIKIHLGALFLLLLLIPPYLLGLNRIGDRGDLYTSLITAIVGGVAVFIPTVWATWAIQAAWLALASFCLCGEDLWNVACLSLSLSRLALAVWHWESPVLGRDMRLLVLWTLAKGL